jgi:hypothetical protein
LGNIRLDVLGISTGYAFYDYLLLLFS